MFKLYKHSLVAALVVSGALVTGTANAAPLSVSYEAIDLPDPVAGADTWQYHFSVLGDLPAGDYLELQFDPALYAYDFTAVTGADPAVFDFIDAIAPLPGTPGYVDLLSSTGSTGVSTFDLTFTWLGGSALTPGAVPWVVLDGTLSPTGLAGSTTPAVPVPEPATIALALAGLGLAALRKRQA